MEVFQGQLREGIRKVVLEYYAGLEETKREGERERMRLRKVEEKRALQQQQQQWSGGRGAAWTGGRWGVSEWVQQVEVDDSSDDGATLSVVDSEQCYQRALDEGWQIYLEKVRIRWEDNNTASSGEHNHPLVVRLPVNLLDKGRTDEEPDRYLHMLHLRGYRDLVEISFQWAKEERPQKPDRDGEKGQSCIVIEDEQRQYEGQQLLCGRSKNSN